MSGSFEDETNANDEEVNCAGTSSIEILATSFMSRVNSLEAHIAQLDAPWKDLQKYGGGGELRKRIPNDQSESKKMFYTIAANPSMMEPFFSLLSNMDASLLQLTTSMFTLQVCSMRA